MGPIFGIQAIHMKQEVDVIGEGGWHFLWSHRHAYVYARPQIMKQNGNFIQKKKEEHKGKKRVRW